jgi:predicted aspartyl protease
MLIDTGADVTLLPASYVEQLDMKPVHNIAYEIQGFDGQPKLAKMVELELVFLGKKFSGQFLLVDQPMGILGRNILNVLSITFDRMKPAASPTHFKGGDKAGFSNLL